MAICLFVVILPSYLLRYSYGPLPYILKIPTTFFEVAFFSILLVWVFKYAKSDIKIIGGWVAKNNLFFFLMVVFFVFAMFGIFVSDMPWRSFGHYKAYFIEPMAFFLILIGRREEISPKDLVFCLGLSTLSIAIYSIFQKFTGLGIATDQWTAEPGRRTTAFFSSPNAIGLYAVPIFLMLAGKKINILSRVDFWKNKKKIFTVVMMLLIFLSVLFSKSEGALIALAVGMTVHLFLIGRRKIAVGIVAIGIITALAVPALRSAVLFVDQAGQNRLSLWRYSTTYLTDSPSNFVFGSGLRQFFRHVQKPYYDDSEMERLIYPHNIFLNFWTEIGLFGMLAFIGIFFCLIYFACCLRKKDVFFGSAMLACLIALLTHGLVDVPYFKNDLAMLFWIIAAVICLSYFYENQYQGKTSVGNNQD
ncbi:MAG: O-antigen ligase family protein [bacterium]